MIFLIQKLFIIIFSIPIMITKINNEVLKFTFKEFGSLCYLIKNKILIDAGSIENRSEFIQDFQKNNLKIENVDTILLTHLHWDHIGNIALFKNAKVYCSSKELEDFQKDRAAFFRMQDLSLLPEIDKIQFHDIKEFSRKNKDFKIIEVPGHTEGSLAFLYKGVLFSGDTLFDETGDCIGRTDLPSSRPEFMESSLKKLLSLKFKILCPGH